MVIDDQKQDLVKANSICMQLDLTYSQSSLSLSLGELTSPIEMSIRSPSIHMTTTQSFKNEAVKAALLTPELLHSDCFPSYLTLENLSGSIDDYFVDSTVFLSTIYEESDEVSFENGGRPCTPRITGLCIVRQDQWHAVRALSSICNQGMDLIDISIK
ncbi:Hypothetical protein GLP15_1549 [Giardia lamblia P15]|uniref:Uncharacterized protein n=1 Tax=Giardia intestinalis (strain P15) TaxID=658858 RepID=E1EXJ9_GIAIA|nr:Hypothetical protein GLP15_1549 [Giardia lamblia P15]